MLLVFNRSLSAQLDQLSLEPTLKILILDQSQNLAAIQLPDLADAALQEQVQHGIQRAFLRGFRVVMAVAAVLAFASALIAAVSIQTPQAQESNSHTSQ